MNFKIYQNQLGVTVFDDYLDYIDTLNNIIDSKIYNFFSDWERYSLQDEKTLHDAKIALFEIKNNHLFIELNLKFGSMIRLIYSNPKFIISSDDLKFLLGADLLVHELYYIEKENRYIHALCFDGDHDLLIEFDYFDFIENN